MSAIPRPEAPPSQLVRAAQARLVANLHARGQEATVPLVGPPDPQSATPWPGPLRPPASPVDSERYEFGEPFAAGGLGLIRRARDRRLGRTIAVKELLRTDPAAERRFLLEAAITARLQHPGIVPLHDIGRFPSGEPYYCMKLVEGLSLEQKIAACKDLPARLALLEHLIAATDAIAYAHRNHVIHRDLKPGNILVGELGETVVIDWGLAKDLGGQIADELADLPAPPANAGTISTMTQHGTVLGTLRYMPPEQARGLPVDARGDVFSLGAVLHHILTGEPPHKDLGNDQLVARVSEGHSSDLAALVPDAPRELVAIARRAMAPRPEDRYPSAEALGEDLRRFRTGRLVGAHRYGAGEVMRLWLRRHRAVATVAASAVLALAVVGGVGIQNVRHQRDLATVAQVDAEAARQTAETARQTAESALVAAREQTNAALLAQARDLLATDLTAALATLARVDLSHGTAGSIAASARDAHLLALAAETRGAPSRTLRGHTGLIENFIPLSDGRLISVDVGGAVWSFDPKTGAGEQLLDLHEPHVELISAADAPVFAAIGERTIHIFRADGTREQFGFTEIDRGPHELRQYSFQLSNTGDRIAALGEPILARVDAPPGPTAVLWDLSRSPAVATILTAPRSGQTVMSPDGRAIAHDAEDDHARLWVDGVTTRLPGLSRPLGFSSDGAHVFGFTDPHNYPIKLTSHTIATGKNHPLGRWVLATTRDNHALAVDFGEFTGGAELSLRSLATGEARWTETIADSYALAQWHEHADFGVAVDRRGDGLALRTPTGWELGSQHAFSHRRPLEIGPHERGQFFADGSFAVAHAAELWVWDDPAPAPDRTTRATTLAALAPTGTLAISHGPDNSGPFGPRAELPDLVVRDLSSGTATTSACLTGLTTLRDATTGLPTATLDDRGRVLHRRADASACLSAPGGPAQLLPLPARATATALGPDLALAIGLETGALLTYKNPNQPPHTHELGAEITSIATVPGGGHIVSTRAGILAVPSTGKTVTLATLDPGRPVEVYRPRVSAVVPHPHSASALLLVPDEDALISHDFTRGLTTRRPIPAALDPLAAYNPDATRVAVTTAGNRLLVLDDVNNLDDPGRTLDLPEPAAALAFLDRDQLAVWADSGALLRVDTTLGKTITLAHAWTPPDVADDHPRLAVGQGGSILALRRGNQPIASQPADSIPTAPAALATWLQARRTTLAD